MAAKLNVLLCHVLNYLLSNMYIYPTTHPSTYYPSAYPPSTYPSTHLSNSFAHPPIHLSIHPLILLSTHSPTHPPTYLYVYSPTHPPSYLPIHPFILLPIYLCIYPSTHLSTYLPIYTSTYVSNRLSISQTLSLPLLKYNEYLLHSLPLWSKSHLMPVWVYRNTSLLPSTSLLVTFVCSQEFRNGYCKMFFSCALKAVIPVSISAGDCL